MTLHAFPFLFALALPARRSGAEHPDADPPGRHRDGAAAGSVRRRSRAARATPPGGATTHSTARLLPQLFLSGNVANLNHGINPDHAARWLDAVHRAVAEPVVARHRVQAADAAHRRNDPGAVARDAIRPVRRRQAEVLPDVARRREPLAGSLQATRDRVGQARAVTQRDGRRRARLSRGARGRRGQSRRTHSSICTRSR